MSRALIVVDVQADFIEGGSLAVEGGLICSLAISHFLWHGKREKRWSKYVATKDWHNPESTNGDHFSDDPDYVDTWPVHCVQFTPGSQFGPGLSASMFSDVFLKGQDKPAYSGFEGVSHLNRKTLLGGYLGAYGIEEVDVCGIATDYCVKATVLDALKYGFKVNVISDLTVAVGDKQAALDEMADAGARIVE